MFLNKGQLPTVFFSPDDGGGTSGDGKFTQAELDAQIQKRLKRAQESFDKKKSEHVAEYLSSIGLDENGLEELLKKNTPEKDLELNKLKRANEKLASQMQELEAAKSNAEDGLASLIKENTFKSLVAGKCNEQQASAAYGLLAKQLVVHEGKLVSTDGVEAGKFVSDFLEANPFLKKAKEPLDSQPPPGNKLPGDKKPNPRHQVPYEGRKDDTGIAEAIERSFSG